MCCNTSHKTKPGWLQKKKRKRELPPFLTIRFKKEQRLFHHQTHSMFCFTYFSKHKNRDVQLINFDNLTECGCTDQSSCHPEQRVDNPSFLHTNNPGCKHPIQQPSTTFWDLTTVWAKHFLISWSTIKQPLTTHILFNCNKMLKGDYRPVLSFTSVKKMGCPTAGSTCPRQLGNC